MSDDAPLDERTTLRGLTIDVYLPDCSQVEFFTSLDGTVWLSVPEELQDTIFATVGKEIELDATVSRGAEGRITAVVHKITPMDEGDPETLWREWYASVNTPPKS